MLVLARLLDKTNKHMQYRHTAHLALTNTVVGSTRVLLRPNNK